MITVNLKPAPKETWKDVPLDIYSKLPGRPPNSDFTKDQLQQKIAIVSRNWLTRMETYMLNTLINVQGIQGDKCGQLNITDETLAFRMKSSLSLIKKSLHSLKKKFPDALKFHYYHPSVFKRRRQIEVDWNLLIKIFDLFEPNCPKFSMIPGGVKFNHETTEFSSIYNNNIIILVLKRVLIMNIT